MSSVDLNLTQMMKLKEFNKNNTTTNFKKQNSIDFKEKLNTKLGEKANAKPNEKTNLAINEKNYEKTNERSNNNLIEKTNDKINDKLEVTEYISDDEKISMEDIKEETLGDTESSKDSILAILNSLLQIIIFRENLEGKKSLDSKEDMSLNKVENSYNELLRKLNLVLSNKETEGDLKEQMLKLKLTLENMMKSTEVSKNSLNNIKNLMESQEEKLEPTKLLTLINEELNKVSKGKNNENDILPKNLVGKDIKEVSKENVNEGKINLTLGKNNTGLQESPYKQSDSIKENIEKLKDVVDTFENQVSLNTNKSSDDKEQSFLKNLVFSDNKETDVNSRVMRANGILNGMNDLMQLKENTVVSVKEGLIVNRENLMADTIKAVKYMEINGLKNLTVKVMPKELGEIVIRLTMEAGKMKLAFNTSNKETYSILNGNMENLVNKLNSQNIKIEPTGINIYNGDTTFFSNEFSGQAFRENKENNKNLKEINKDSISNEDIEQEADILEGNVNTVV